MRCRTKTGIKKQRAGSFALCPFFSPVLVLLLTTFPLVWCCLISFPWMGRTAELQSPLKAPLPHALLFVFDVVQVVASFSLSLSSMFRSLPFSWVLLCGTLEPASLPLQCLFNWFILVSCACSQSQPHSFFSLSLSVSAFIYLLLVPFVLLLVMPGEKLKNFRWVAFFMMRSEPDK